METKIPGMKGKHRWISDNCLSMKGVDGSIDEAVEDARQFLLDCIPRWASRPGTRFHVVVTVEPGPARPQSHGGRVMKPQVNCVCEGVEFGTYENAVSIKPPWREKTATVDLCVLPLVRWLWYRGIRTIESCCGHGKKPGYVAVEPEFHDAMLGLGFQPDRRTEGAGVFVAPTPSHTEGE